MATVAAEMRLMPIEPHFTAQQTIVRLIAVYEILFGALRQMARESVCADKAGLTAPRSVRS